MDSTAQAELMMMPYLSQRTSDALNGQIMYQAKATGAPITISVSVNSAQHDKYIPATLDRHTARLNTA